MCMRTHFYWPVWWRVCIYLCVPLTGMLMHEFAIILSFHARVYMSIGLNTCTLIIFDSLLKLCIYIVHIINMISIT